MKTPSPIQFIVLGAGLPTSFTDPLEPDAANRANSMEWIRQAVDQHVASRHFVAGYHVENAAAHTSGFTISVNADWESTGSIASLLCAPIQPGHSLLVSYADVVFREDIVARMIADDSDVVLAIDSVWKDRYARRSTRDMAMAEKVAIEGGSLIGIGRSLNIEAAGAEFIGLVKFSARAASLLGVPEMLDDRLRRDGMLPDLVTALMEEASISVSWHDVAGDWAELNAPQDLAHFVFGTKAETLDRLRPLVRSLHIEEQVRFTVAEFRDAPDDVIRAIQAAFSDEPVIVRSSARSEDSWQTANAGAFRSIPDINAADTELLQGAIREVIESYREGKDEDQVLVQPMIRDAVANGVAFTRTLSHGAPYFTINYDATGTRTDAVTAGAGEPQMLFVHHDAVNLPPDTPTWTGALLEGIRELIALVGYDSLDLEFCIDAGDTVRLLQLRPIAVDHRQWQVEDQVLKAELDLAHARFHSLQQATGNTLGSRAVFGVMPDWNPAEIIGLRPSLLSVSLYRYLICDEIWARQRMEYGYRDVRPQPLIVSFAGHPYVNVRASLSSFIPRSLPDELGNRLVDHYLDRLIENPHLHDKVEFDVALTCVALDFHDRARRQLKPAGFDDDDIGLLHAGLVDVTRRGFARYPADIASIATLGDRFEDIISRDIHPLERACMLLEDCHEYGTLAFSHLARGAFVAMTVLRSAVAQGLVARGFLDAYLGSISTVAKEFITDGQAAGRDADSRRAFIHRYGHLRPGTYDILSPTYAERSDVVYPRQPDEASVQGSNERGDHVHWSREIWGRIEGGLADLGIEIGCDEFDAFCRAVIEGREQAKFVFTRNLSQALDDFVVFGEASGVDRSRLADVPVDCLFALRAGEGFGDPGKFIRQMSDLFQNRRRLSQAAELPPLIHHQDQLFAFYYPPSQPNFITSKSITAPVRVLGGGRCGFEHISGRIVVITQADPGFDWLFGCGIAGLVTTYGGANSHMAIRCAEFHLPAAIGVGEVMFERLQHADTVALDCGNRTIRVLG